MRRQFNDVLKAVLETTRTTKEDMYLSIQPVIILNRDLTFQKLPCLASYKKQVASITS